MSKDTPLQGMGKQLFERWKNYNPSAYKKLSEHAEIVNRVGTMLNASFSIDIDEGMENVIHRYLMQGILKDLEVNDAPELFHPSLDAAIRLKMGVESNPLILKNNLPKLPKSMDEKTLEKIKYLLKSEHDWYPGVLIGRNFIKFYDLDSLLFYKKRIVAHVINRDTIREKREFDCHSVSGSAYVLYKVQRNSGSYKSEKSSINSAISTLKKYDLKSFKPEIASFTDLLFLISTHYITYKEMLPNTEKYSNDDYIRSSTININGERLIYTSETSFDGGLVAPESWTEENIDGKARYAVVVKIP